MTGSGASAGFPWLPVCFTLLASIQAVPAQTTQPVEPRPELPAAAERKPYDPWTSETLTGDWGAVRCDLADVGVKLELSYQQQYQQNFHGGLRTHNGHRFSGSYDLVGQLDFGKMKLMPDAGFYLKAKGGYSDGINPDKVGASTYANPNSDAYEDYPIYVDKWWYWHKFLEGRIELRLGVLETVKDLYDVSLYANHEDKDFINSLSFRNATIPHTTGMGAFVKVEPVEWFYFQAGAIDTQAKKRHTRFDTAFHDEAWFTGLWELGLTPEWQSPKGPMPGRYRAGLWYDPTSRPIFIDTLGGRRRTSYSGDDVGFYFGFDQMIWKENEAPKDAQGLGFYARYGHADRDVHPVSDYGSTGVSYKGLVPGRDEDVAAFGVSQAIYSELYRNYQHPGADRETVYEWYYQYFLTPWCAITPDLQVITNPSGDKDDRDALVGGVRIRIIF